MRLGSVFGLTPEPKHSELHFPNATISNRIGEHLAIWRIYYGFFFSADCFRQMTNCQTEFEQNSRFTYSLVMLWCFIKHISWDVTCAPSGCVSFSVCPVCKNQWFFCYFSVFLEIFIRYINAWVEFISDSNSWAMMIYGVRFWFDFSNDDQCQSQSHHGLPFMKYQNSHDLVWCFEQITHFIQKHIPMQMRCRFWEVKEKTEMMDYMGDDHDIRRLSKRAW